MRPLRFSIFLAALLGMLSTAGYLWAPLVVPKARHLHLPQPTIRSSLPPLRIAVVQPPPAPPALHVPERVAGVGAVHLKQVGRGAPTPAAVSAPASQSEIAFKPPAKHAMVKPSVSHAPKASAPAAPSTQPVVHPAPASPPAVEKATPSPSPSAPSPSASTRATAPAAPIPPVLPATPPPAAAAAPTVDTQPASAPPAAPPAPEPAPAVVSPPIIPPPATPPPPATTPPPPPATTPPPVTTPPPAPEPPPAATKPGWGCGDQNHEHTGPP